MSDELHIRADVERLDEVLEFLNTHLESWDCMPKTQIQMDVAVEEIFVNVAHYAYEVEGGGDVTIRIDFDEEKRQVAVTFIDSGIPYDPLAKSDPDVNAPLEDRPIGGLGIYMVKKSMDDMRYSREGDTNNLTLIKNL